MVNEKKVRLMTRISIFEKNSRDREMVMSRYFIKDYVKYKGIQTVISSTICYWLAVGVYLYLDFEQFLNDFVESDYYEILKAVIVRYLIFCIIMYIFSFVVHSIKYMLSRKKILSYNRNLTRLARYYDKEEKVEKYGKKSRVRDFGGEEDGQDKGSSV